MSGGVVLAGAGFALVYRNTTAGVQGPRHIISDIQVNKLGGQQTAIRR